MRKMGVFVVPFGVEKPVKVPLRVFKSLKWSTAGAVVVSFRILSQQKSDWGYLTINQGVRSNCSSYYADAVSFVVGFHN